MNFEQTLRMAKQKMSIYNYKVEENFIFEKYYIYIL
ncbi:hypothetical protein J2Z42_002784 [Clostridium algifaecis]|uniref:Uncharacterized protein n=1 Tax=Clostridium algifaecis TaxID=1472040 RepID=A0ABS4KVK8_9CLOT|nr:hypothetical protein [Clostridium algifaecis]